MSALQLFNQPDRTLPPLFDPDQQPILNLFDFLKEAFEQTWALQGLFIAKPPANRHFPAVRAHPLLYALADFAWAHNHTYLDDEIKRISFRNIRTPTMDTVTRMHALREDLDFLRAEVEQTTRHADELLRTARRRTPFATRHERDSSRRSAPHGRGC
jgi:hypothetical protein